MRAIDYAGVVQAPISWTRRVAAYLDALPANGWSAHDDWLLIEAMSLGIKVDTVKLPKGQRTGSNAARAVQLQEASRDDRGLICLDGRAALINAPRERVA